MNPSFFRKRPICRCAGDPVDVVTGANFFELLDFRLTGPLPLLWVRHFNSHLVNQHLALGWGHTHGFDQTLTADLDGIRYTNHLRDVIGFPPLEFDGDTAAADGLVLERRSESLFALHEQDEPTLEFTFDSGQSVALLTALQRGDNSIRLTYQAGRLSGLVDSLGRHITVEYDPVGRLSGLTLSPGGEGGDRPLLQYTYNEQHDLIEAVDPSLARTQYRYDNLHRMVARVDRRGYSFLYEYDEEGRCTRSGGEDGMQEVRLRYHPVEGLTEVTSPVGGRWQYFYEANGTVTKVVDPCGGLYAFEYDDAGRLIQEVDPNKNAHPITYDDAGAPIESPFTSGRFVGPPPFYVAPPEDADYRIAENPLEFELGDLLAGGGLDQPPSLESLPPQIRDLIRPSVAVPYTQSADEPGCVQPDPSPLESSACVLGQCDCDGFSVGFYRHEHGLIHIEKFVDETSRRWKYDPNGNILSYTDREGHRSSYGYVSWDQLARYVDPLGRVIQYQQNHGEELTSVRDPGGTESRYEYDLKNRLTHVYRQGVLKEEYRYDAADNLIRKLDGQGRTLLSIDIGEKNRETAIHFASGETQEFAYDDRGHIIRATGQHCELLREYDESGRLLSDRQNGLGAQRGPNDDDSGGEKITILSKFTFIHSHAEDGALVIKDPTGRLHILRTLDGGVVYRRMGNGTEETAQFDQGGHCLFKATRGSVVFGRTWIREYVYSPEGDLTAVRDNQRGEDRYTYDAAHRLIESSGVSGLRQQFRRDAADNLLSHPELENIVIADRNLLASAGRETFHYNERHDLMVREQPGARTTYEYDSFDQLQRVQSPAGEITFTYDPLGRRLTKTHNGHITRYCWDGDRLAAESDPSGRVRVYAYADDLALVPLLWIEYDSLDADPATGRPFYVFTDQIGTPIRVENDLGETVWSARSSPYGAAHVEIGEDFYMPLRWPGHYYDEETGLHYNRYRYYDPRLGRYIQSDPEGVGGGLNLYAYGSNPLVEVDVLGLGKKPPKCCSDGEECPHRKKPKKESTRGRTQPKRPVFRVSRAKYPNHVRMLENARAKGHPLTGQTRNGGRRAARRNRYESQKDIRRREGPPPTGHDYDEFPYASTRQGGAGAHVEPVRSEENQAVGRDLGAFYANNNIQDGDSFDVRIVR